MRALVREPSDRIVECELSHLARAPIDVRRAREQHRGYVELLAALGANIVWLDPLPDHPDGVFVEDVAVVAAPIAVLTRPGAESRRGEVPSMRDMLHAHGVQTEEISDPGQLDGGDVLAIGRTFYVGATARTNDDGRRQFADAVRPHGYDVIPVAVDGILHLKTGVTALPDGTLVANVRHVDLNAFGGLPVLAAAEPQGSDVLLLGDTVVVSASAPMTATAIAARGYDVRTVEVDELEKAEAGVTCMSVLLRD
ncbi:MAG: N(G),N(G)-dimethylarginine dimethylaminohydrolase [Candidatus Nanopelagicales bacterium]